jgi:hypothetical protein
VSAPIRFAVCGGGGCEPIEEAVDAADHGSCRVFAWREKISAGQGVGCGGSHGQDAEENA